MAAKACARMQRVISALARKYGLDFAAEHFYVRLARRGCGESLVISRFLPSLGLSPAEVRVEEQAARNFVCVAEEDAYPGYWQRQHPIQSVIFFTARGEWIPFSGNGFVGMGVGDRLHGQCRINHFQYAELSPDGGGFVQVDEDKQADLADKTERWARIIEDEWQLLEYGEKIEWLEGGRKFCRPWDRNKHWYTDKIYEPGEWVYFPKFVPESKESD